MILKRVGKYIGEERRRQGLSPRDAASRAGYRNLAKGIRRLSEIEEKGIAIPSVVAAFVRALGLDSAVVDGIMADEILENRQAEHEHWRASRDPLDTIRAGHLCERCPFFERVQCHHPLADDGRGRDVPVVRWVGHARPAWCPLRSHHGEEQRRRERLPIPLSIVVEGERVSGRVVHLEPDSITVEIRAPYRGLRRSWPPIMPMGMFSHQWLEYQVIMKDGEMTDEGRQRAESLLEELYRDCRDIDRHRDAIMERYGTFRKERDRLCSAMDDDRFFVAERRELLNRLRTSEIDNHAFQRFLREAHERHAVSRHAHYESLARLEGDFFEWVLRLAKPRQEQSPGTSELPFLEWPVDREFIRQFIEIYFYGE